MVALYQGGNVTDTRSLLIYVDHDDPIVEQTLREFLTDLGHSATACGSFDEVRCPSQEFGSARNHWQKGSDHIFATNFVARYL